MKTFQLTLRGFRADTDKTDHLIKWVNASSVEAAKTYAGRQGWDVIEIDASWGDTVLTRADGVDAILDDNGNAISQP